jgi:hypothetical protein
MVNFKAITFIGGGMDFYFYDGSDSDCGHIFGVKELTLPKALSILKAKGVDPESNFKVTITAYYW